MFYCEECREKNKYPETILFKSYGPCDICGKKDLCNNVASKNLPLPKKPEGAIKK